MELQRPFQVVTPTLDGDVLAVLALADSEFTVGQLKRMLPASGEGIRKVLRRLAGQGIVSVAVHGPVSSYRLNRTHLAAQPIIDLAQLRARFFDKLGHEVTEWSVAPMYAAVFGSAARGALTVSSDIDLLLVRPDGSDEDVWDEQVLELAQTVTQWTGNDVRSLEYTVSELSAARGPVLEDVAREGLTVHGDPSWFRRQVKAARSQR
jgi:predicted nucleotidyltransferase